MSRHRFGARRSFADDAVTPPPDAPGFQSRFIALDNRIEQFKAALPSLSHATSMRPDVVRSLLTIHTLCHCATVQLHLPLSHERHPSNDKALAAANTAASMLQGIPVPQLIYVDPIMGVGLDAFETSSYLIFVLLP